MNELLPEPSTETIEKVKSLLKRIKRAKGADHDAEDELAAMGIEGALAVGKTLDPQIASARSSNRRHKIVFYTLFSALLSLIALTALIVILPTSIPVLNFIFSMLYVILFAIVIWAISIAWPRDFYSIGAEANALLCVRDKRILPYLLNLPVRQSSLQKKIHRAATDLLPTLEADDAYLITSEVRRQFVESLPACDKLYKGVFTVEHEDYLVAMLEAYKKVGDFASRPIIERLAKSGHNPRIKQAAQECLPFLPEREDDLRNTLLQPSMKPGAAPEELLRASISASQTEPSQLLRAVQESQSLNIAERESAQAKETLFNSSTLIQETLSSAGKDSARAKEQSLHTSHGVNADE